MMCYFAAFKIGVAIVIMNFMLKKCVIGYIINHSEFRMFVVEDSVIVNKNSPLMGKIFPHLMSRLDSYLGYISPRQLEKNNIITK